MVVCRLPGLRFDLLFAPCLLFMVIWLAVLLRYDYGLFGVFVVGYFVIV